MSIRVTCPGCHSRFQVSDKFGGKSGPCPKCKVVMKIPDKSEEVVVHVPDDGPKDSKGQSVLKPIKRKETKISWPLIVAIGGAALVVPLVAWMLGRTFPTSSDGVVEADRLVLGAGAVLLALPIVLGGYRILRNDELEPYSGLALWTRAGICSVVYAALWGLHWYMDFMLYDGDVSPPEVLIALPILFIPGALGVDGDFGLGRHVRLISLRFLSPGDGGFAAADGLVAAVVCCQPNNS